jgi:hypothetical protein
MGAKYGRGWRRLRGWGDEPRNRTSTHFSLAPLPRGWRGADGEESFLALRRPPDPGTTGQGVRAAAMRPWLVGHITPLIMVLIIEHAALGIDPNSRGVA